MGMLGIVAGTVFLKEPLFEKMELIRVETPFGEANVHVSDKAAYIPRHGRDRKNYILPHKINYLANMQAFKQLDVSDIIGINSTGSLKKNLEPGTIVVPHDFICLSPTSTMDNDRLVHVVPVINDKLRSQLISAALSVGSSQVSTSGVYWQTTGPRFETKAEINLMASYADVVGMTMASEAVSCCELGLSYASICSVDNFAHGIGDEPLSAKAVQEAANENARTIREIIQRML